MTVFEYCRDRLIKEDKRAEVSADAPREALCAYEGGLQSIYGSIVGANPGEDLLQHQKDVLVFWFQYWILRENEAWYFEVPAHRMALVVLDLVLGALELQVGRPRHGSLVWMNTTCSYVGAPPQPGQVREGWLRGPHRRAGAEARV